MQILHREPAHWSGPIVTKDIKRSHTLSFYPSAGGMAILAGMGRTTKYRISAVAKLRSILDRGNVLKYELLENKVERNGLPIAMLPCCVVLRTGGERFSMGVRFDAGVCGEGARMWMRARVKRDSFINWANLTEGRDTCMEREEVLDRMETEGFRKNLKMEIGRAWAEGNGGPAPDF
jgi:hypothetical protein